eukprot:SAG31_NODE_311_length_17866_cov_7.010750_6_plen_89_part_00
MQDIRAQAPNAEHSQDTPCARTVWIGPAMRLRDRRIAVQVRQSGLKVPMNRGPRLPNVSGRAKPLREQRCQHGARSICVDERSSARTD